MKEEIKKLLEDAMPLVDFDSDFLFAELDSLGMAQILMLLSEEYQVPLGLNYATPKNLKSLDSIVRMVEEKLSAKA